MASTNLICRLEYVDANFGVSVGKQGVTSADWRTPHKVTITSGQVTEVKTVLATSESVTCWNRDSAALAGGTFQQGFAWSDTSDAYVALFTSGAQWHQQLRPYQPYLFGNGTTAGLFYSATTTLITNTSELATSASRLYQIVMHNIGSANAKVHFIGISTSA